MVTASQSIRAAICTWRKRAGAGACIGSACWPDVRRLRDCEPHPSSRFGARLEGAYGKPSVQKQRAELLSKPGPRFFPTLRFSSGAFLPFPQQIDHLRRDLASALIELLRRQVGNRMRHHDETEVRQAPGAGHCLSGLFEYVRDNGRRRNALLFEYDTVEHTARAA